MRPERPPLSGLYAITPERADTAALVRDVAACIEGGATMVQYRAKTLPPGAALAQARALAALCRERGALFIVNDSIALAAAAAADGVHVGRDDGSVREARIALPRGIVGVSCYGEVGRAAQAGRDGADYVAVGAMFPSRTKPHAKAAPLALVGEARRASGLPVAAIGGIDAGNAAAVIAAGADMLAVISALFDAADPRAAARAIAAHFDSTAGASHA